MAELVTGHKGIRIRDHRAFADVGGFEEIGQINVLVGRNNAGKSSLLDAVAFLCDMEDTTLERGGSPGSVVIESRLPEELLKRHFPESTGGGPVHGNHWAYGQKWIDNRVVWSLAPGGKRSLLEVQPQVETISGAKPEWVKNQLERVVKELDPPLSGKSLLRVLSDRDVRPESDRDLAIMPDGRGATTAIRSFLNEAALDRTLVTEAMLEGLNQVFSPEATFSEIEIQRLADQQWEVWLAVDQGPLVPLSSSGSGLRTVLLVLAQIHLTPAIEGRSLDKYVLAFEELENNLHPALQRRLMTYLTEIVIENDLTAFITTHSHAVIDQFASDERAVITHVKSDQGRASTARVSGYPDHTAVLDDLDVRASDLLQANGIIWVEGPSDRLYVNRWLEVATNGELREGTHYQCIFYGGSLLAHLTALVSSDNADEEDFLEILRVNRNAALLMDSDRASPTQELNLTKTRLLQEIESVGGWTWVTAGREIENYLAASSVGSLLRIPDSPEVSKFEFFERYLDRLDPGAGRRFLRSKTFFAGQVLPHIEMGGMHKYDLTLRLKELTDTVRGWNRMN